MSQSNFLRITIILALALSCGKKKDEDQTPTEPSKEQVLKTSKTKWDEVKKNGNTYTYKVTFLEDTGKVSDGAYVTVVGVKDGVVACRSYWHSSGDSFIEGKDDLNSHKDKGASARSIDDLYQQCSQGLALHKSSFYLHYGDQGILLGCNNDCNNSCDIDEIPFSEPKFGIADCNSKITF